MTRFVVYSQLLSTLAMLGLIWFVQVVHYPMFRDVGNEVFAAYEAKHSRLTTYVVMPLMLLELASAILLVSHRPTHISFATALTGLCLVGVIWAATFFLSVPQHNALMSGFDESAWRKLVSTNWVRTIAWTLRGILVLGLVVAKD